MWETGLPQHAACSVAVKVWDARGCEAEWSEAAEFATAPHAGQLNASWISEQGATEDTATTVLRRSFEADAAPVSAVVSVSGLGHYELTVNGRRVGDHAMDPGWTKCVCFCREGGVGWGGRASGHPGHSCTDMCAQETATHVCNCAPSAHAGGGADLSALGHLGVMTPHEPSRRLAVALFPCRAADTQQTEPVYMPLMTLRPCRCHRHSCPRCRRESAGSV